MNVTDHPNNGIDALLPAEIAEKAEEVGVVSLVALAVLAGAFIALGAMKAPPCWLSLTASSRSA